MPRKTIAKLELSHLLKRRKMTLKRYVDDFAITTYDALLRQCTIHGVVPPNVEEFELVFPMQVSDPGEGIVIFSDPEEPVLEPTLVEDIEAPKKARRKKREQHDGDDA